MTDCSEIVYLFGCDMGGWHNKSNTKGDALAICKWNGKELEHLEETAEVTYFPIRENSILKTYLNEAKGELARIVVAIDAALAWPRRFRDLVTNVPRGSHDFHFDLGAAIDNPYLYRETERFIKKHVQTDAKESPLTAVGDKFGNNSSKAQALVRWFCDNLENPYRPPFDKWCRDTAKNQRHTIIEVYPTASMKSELFKQLLWPKSAQRMSAVGNTDIADAKRCAMSGFCYAVEVGIIKTTMSVPAVWTPDDAEQATAPDALTLEGWIFAPKNSSTEVRK